jgi:hypothetical protein
MQAARDLEYCSPRKEGIFAWKPPPPSAMETMAMTSPGRPQPFARKAGTELIVKAMQPMAYKLVMISIVILFRQKYRD